LRNYQIFSAPSLADVLRQLQAHRPTGYLTVCWLSGNQQEEMRMFIKQGQPISILRGQFEEAVNEPLLAWLNSRGEIQFYFQVLEPPLSLPAPKHPSGVLPKHPTGVLKDTGLPTKTKLQPISPNTQNSIPTPQIGQTHLNPHTNPMAALPPRTPRTPRNQGAKTNKSVTPKLPDPGQPYPPTSSYENIVPIHTTLGRDYAVVQLPRYDRTIFLLINGRRNAVEISQLTKRPEQEVITTLQRLREQQLIIFDE
jgi:hypothetical protein